MKLWLRSLVAAALLLAVAPLSAGAATILTVTGGGLNAANVNAICFSGAFACNGTGAELRLEGTGSVSGTITVDGLNAIFDLDLVSASFKQVPLGTGTVEEVIFSTVAYTATVPISLTGTGVSFTQDGFGTGTAAGTFDSFGPAAVPLDVAAGFAVGPLFGNANCGLTAGNVGQCSISFGEFFFPLTIDSADYTAIHVFNVDVAPVPEPSALLLLPLALGAALTQHRRRS